eukprot:PhM_4_TR16204/c0_g1_i1/m.42220
MDPCDGAGLEQDAKIHANAHCRDGCEARTPDPVDTSILVRRGQHKDREEEENKGHGDGVQHPQRKDSGVEVGALLAVHVHCGEIERKVVVADILVKHSERHDRERREEDIPKVRVVVLREFLSGEAREELVPVVRERKGHVLVVAVGNQLRDADEVQTAVHEKEPLEEAELGNGVVTREHRLLTLHAPGDADTNVRLLDHRDVVRSVADGEGKGALLVADKVHDLGLLFGRDTAAHDGGTLQSKVEEVTVGLGTHSVLLLERMEQRSAVDGDAVLGARIARRFGVRRLDQVHDGVLLAADDCVHVHAGVEEGARHGDVHSGLHLVARQHPDLDARTQHRVDARRDALLQFVLNGGDAQELKVGLDFVGEHRDLVLHVFRLALVHGDDFAVPRRVFRFGETAARDAQSAQPIERELSHHSARGLVPLLYTGELRKHGAVRPFAVQIELPCAVVERHDAHALSCGVKLVHVEDRVGLGDAHNLQHKVFVRAAFEDEALSLRAHQQSVLVR